MQATCYFNGKVGIEGTDELIKRCKNYARKGVGGVLMWVCILAVAFIAVGFMFFGLDKLEKKDK